MNKKVLIDKQALIDGLMKIPGVGSNSDALETIKRFPSYEPQKPVVPQFVAEWIEYAKKKGDSLRGAFCPWELYGAEYIKANNWIDANQETFARAWLDGYEVEKEPLYYVKLPYEVWDEEAAELKKEFLYLAYDLTSDETSFFPTKEPRRGFSTKLDEITIKSADKNYWPFAEPVEEVKG